MDIHYNLGLSGEPPQDRVVGNYGVKAGIPKACNEVFDLVLRHRKYQKQYMDYWNSTAQLTSSGRPVDAILSPVSPVPPHPFFGTTDFGKSLPPLRPKNNMLISLGYTPWVNVIDSPSVVFPVTRVYADVDKVDKTYQPLNELDGKIWDECKSISISGGGGADVCARRSGDFGWRPDRTSVGWTQVSGGEDHRLSRDV
jgi:amidase